MRGAVSSGKMGENQTEILTSPWNASEMIPNRYLHRKRKIYKYGGIGNQSYLEGAQAKATGWSEPDTLGLLLCLLFEENAEK